MNKKKKASKKALNPYEGLDSKVKEEFINVDPLKQSYHQSIVQHPDRFKPHTMERTALLCVDLQYLDAVPGFGVFAEGQHSNVSKEAQQYYFNELKHVVLPNIRRLQDAFRSKGLEVIHIRIQSLTKDGRDRNPGHKRLKLHAAPGSKEAEFVEEVAPQGDEIIINKTASGVFASTNLHYVLKNMDINSLFVVGVYTDECVSTTVRDGSDLGFFVTLVDDACASVTQKLHDFSIATLKDRYSRVITTEQAIKDVLGS